jgi:adenine-specific DNA-methyltransferase
VIRGNIHLNGKNFNPPTGMHWKTSTKGLQQLANESRIVIEGNMLRFIRFLDDYPVFPSCLLMTTDPGGLVLDITCGSGTAACVAEQWGRRWITCDTSRITITLTKKRLMTATFDYYKIKLNLKK